MSRTPPEWIGKSDDTAPPASVRQRVLERYNRTCYLSGLPIKPGDAWHIEHIVPLWLKPGGNRESNMAPALVEPHKRKSAAEAKIRAKVGRTAQKHSGARPRPKQQIQSRGFEKAAKERKKAQKVVRSRSIYQDK